MQKQSQKLVEIQKKIKREHNLNLMSYLQIEDLATLPTKLQIEDYAEPTIPEPENVQTFLKIKF